MPEYECESCGKLFHGWAENKTCPDCGGKLKPRKEKRP